MQTVYVMHPTNISILCTRPLPATLLDEAMEQGLSIEVLSFIETESILSAEAQQEIKQASVKTATVIFTSMNAVDAVTVFLDGHQPAWTIYSLGTTTHKLISNYFGEECIAGIANDASALATLIAKEAAPGEVIFFCGDQRRDELPAILKQYSFDVQEITVYHTIATPHKISKAYHGILFFSPSAADSFFSSNILPESTVLFAIGTTTANEIKKHTHNKIIISDAPGKENLVHTMMEYF